MFYFSSAGLPVFAFFKHELLEARKSLKVFFLQPNSSYSKIFFGTFSFYLRWENISEGLLKFCKLISNLILGQVIGCLENDDLENDDQENNDLENNDLENDDVDGDGVARRITRLEGYRRREIRGR